MMDNPHSTTDKEMTTMAEEELSRLCRQLRIMEEDRQAFSEETSIKLKKQRKIIKILTKEKQNMMEDLNVVTCKSHKRKDRQLSMAMQSLLTKYEDCCLLVEEGKREIEELNTQIKKLEANIKEKRPSTTVTETEYSTKIQDGRKASQTLQNRLDNSVKRFCGVLTENKSLREEIDHLLKERSNFNKSWESLLAQIAQGKKFMVDLIEQATMAYDQREEWCSKLTALKKRASNDYLAHTEQMREMQRKLDHDHDLKEFLGVKGQKRILKDLEEKEKKKKELQIQRMEDQLERYREIMSKIQLFCNEEDVDRIASQFVKQEEENFALFNYVNELNHEIEMLNENIDELSDKIDEQKELSDQRSKECQESLESLKLKAEDSRIQAEKDEILVINADTTLDNILSGIQSIFHLLDCDKGPILKLLGDDININSHNVMIYLGMIEKKITDIITTLYFTEKSMHPGKKATNL